MSHENPAVSVSKSLLGEIAASVFCDKIAADAVAEAEKLCTENKILEPISNELLTFKLEDATEDDIVLDIRSYDGEDDDFYLYTIADNTHAFPHENVGSVVTVLSGVRSFHDPFSSLSPIEDPR